MIQRRSREEMRDGFRRRMQQNQQAKDAGFWGPLFRKDIQIPFMKCDEGNHLIDILDYIAGKNDPEPGKPAYCFEFYYYSNVGAGQGPILAVGKTFGFPDPIAEDAARKRRDGWTDKQLKSISPVFNPRVLYNTICLDSKEEESKGVQVFHTSSYLMEDYLREMATGMQRPGMEKLDAIVDFTDPVNGKSIFFKREGKKEHTSFILHQFRDRPAGFVIPDSILEKCFVLDELVYIPSYEELQVYYYGKGQHMPGSESLGAPSADSPEPSRFSSRFDGNQPSDIPAGVERPPEDRTARQPEQERKPEPNLAPQQANLCPAGHVFGVDIDKYPKDCDACDKAKWRDCVKENQAKTKSANGGSAPAETTRQPDPAPAANTEQARQPDPAPAANPPDSGERRRRRI